MCKDGNCGNDAELEKSIDLGIQAAQNAMQSFVNTISAGKENEKSGFFAAGIGLELLQDKVAGSQKKFPMMQKIVNTVTEGFKEADSRINFVLVDDIADDKPASIKIDPELLAKTVDAITQTAIDSGLDPERAMRAAESIKANGVDPNSGSKVQAAHDAAAKALEAIISLEGDGVEGLAAFCLAASFVIEALEGAARKQAETLPTFIPMWETSKALAREDILLRAN
jgi:hypothetical protein